MTSVESSTIVLHEERKRIISHRSEYNVDLWGEFKKRWMVFGVLVAVALAVVSPRLGAPGGNYPACSHIDHFRTHSTSYEHVINFCSF